MEIIFKDWNISREQFYTLKSAQEIIDHYKKFSKDFSTSFTLPANDLANFIYYYFRKDKTADLKILEDGINKHFPSSVDEFYIQLARNYMDKEQLEEAEKIYTKRIQDDPLSFRSYDGLSKILFKRKAFQQAESKSKKCLEIAQQLKARQWLLNELNANYEKITAQIRTK